ncbi:MAG: hydantoinase/oxoprolinase family protein [Planctomycetes bacterium]|nr:hydantoinase/oxoprolinase family protein [Planctomycetota bacterium]
MARIGIDTGGTFTDFVRLGGEPGSGPCAVHKVLSTPDDPARAVLAGLAGIGALGTSDRLVHGTTVATNALLTRSSPPVAFLTTRGFRDILEIGRQDRPDLYALEPARPEPLVPRHLRLEVAGRIGVDGTVLEPLDEAAVARIAARLVRAGLRSAAVGFLHSFAWPAHERKAAAILRRAGLAVCASFEVLREHREYERFSTTVVNAYVAPVVSRYLGRLARAAGGGRLSVMQSNGGIVSWRACARLPARTVLSGPAGGVVAAREAGRAAGFPRVISFDMGGTSTDVCLIDGEARLATDLRIGGIPVALPAIDVHTVGAGGGSIARVDAGGALAVGPGSAGADPGPACYGRGGREATVTDAHVFLGLLPPDRFLGGRMALDAGSAAAAVSRLARRAGLSPRAAALGILRVAEATMERAIRVVSLERGHDPSDFTLVAFGGAGGLHGAALAAGLGMERVLVPPDPGSLSALGMARAAVVQDLSQAALGPLGPHLGGIRDALAARLSRSMAAEGIAGPRIDASLDLRYRGQSFEIEVPFDGGREAFEEAHERLWLSRHPGREVEAVSVRVRATGEVAAPPPAAWPRGGADGSRALLFSRRAAFPAGERETAFFDRALLRAGNRLPGPAVVLEPTGTTVVPPGFAARVDRLGNLLVERGGPEVRP